MPDGRTTTVDIACGACPSDYATGGCVPTAEQPFCICGVAGWPQCEPTLVVAAQCPPQTLRLPGSLQVGLSAATAEVVVNGVVQAAFSPDAPTYVLPQNTPALHLSLRTSGRRH
ncbi:hypothetical protein PAPYR_6994 [Paratrimastix pyriformis]|uniref:Uncharacterized protein n=1 Tax=Paratrimastix pyriformis TaxID=342808 RepID=A0ABQ8UIH6_9EUKA|nr:hypothetical protein PAPYR_6994 [Paratrimastix pyriformis]